MSNIQDIFNQYFNKLDRLDLELLIASIIKKPREFVIVHPEFELNKYQISSIKYKVSRRIASEPLAYILGEKDFYGLRFKVNKNVLIPRPETELIVEQALRKIQETPKSLMATGQARNNNQTIIDLGTGSGNIIIAIAKKMGFFENGNYGLRFLATDISTGTLRVAKQNAKLNKVDKKIKFIKGNLLEPILKSQISNLKSQI